MLLREFGSQHELYWLTAEQATISTSYKLFIGLSSLLAVIFFKRTYSRKKSYRVSNSLILLVLMSSIIVVGVTAPGLTIIGLFKNLRFNPSELQNMGHILGFAGLTVAAFSISNRFELSKIDIAIKLVFFAVLTEVVQRHTIDRSPSMEDIGFDVIGMLIGICVWWICLGRMKDE